MKEILRSYILFFAVLIFGFLLVLPLLSNGQTESGLFTRNLSLGATGSDVKLLQITLNKDPETRIASTGPGSPGQETSYFGTFTKKAVTRYQDLHKKDVLSPLGLLSGTGFVGVLTRKKLNGTLSFVSVAKTPVSGSPIITLVSPKSGKDGVLITISGSNFSAKNTLTVGLNTYKDIPSLDGKTLVITLNSELLKTIFPGLANLTESQKEIVKRNSSNFITHGILVENEYGKSNEETFELAPF